jgi:isoquinoline 1-oxidoreductase alpha subunit
MLQLTVNGERHTLDIDPETPLLWVLRERLNLAGAKYGCGIGLCGSCTVHIDNRARRACLIRAGDVLGKSITTIEGLGVDSAHIQQAWRDIDVSQCGYCQPGMIMTTVALLRDKPSPTDADIDAAITNICRCGTYNRVRRAIHAAAKQQEDDNV